MGNILNKITKKRCLKCGETYDRIKTQKVIMNNRVYEICPKCAWDLEVWFHTQPVQFGDENISVIPEMAVTNGEEEEGAE